MEPRIIKDEQQYQDSLEQVACLAIKDPSADSIDGARLELLAKLVDDYERVTFSIPKPDPIDAIAFRMEQLNLRQIDIADYVGGRNRVSEIMNRKRSLTLPMIRSLHEHLGIPLELLVKEPNNDFVPDEEIDESQIPLALLIKRGWLKVNSTAQDLLRRFQEQTRSPILLRDTKTFGANARTNPIHVWLWLSRVRELADANSTIYKRFDRNHLDEDFIRYVVRLSYMHTGPRLAKECLEERGISLVVEPHLPRTHIDGAAMLSGRNTPIIGLSLRHDRLDNFWFTLIHELVHAWKHLNVDKLTTIVDEEIEKPSTDDLEKEANEEAARIMIPKSEWRRSRVYSHATSETIQELADKLQVSPAIVAGRVRYESGNYSRFPKLVGYRQVRAFFPEARWVH